jgi:hypothetical protein
MRCQRHPRHDAKEAHLDTGIAAGPDVHKGKGEGGGEEGHGDERGEGLELAAELVDLAGGERVVLDGADAQAGMP